MVSTSGRAQTAHLRKHERDEAWDEAEVEVFDEELVTHHPLRNKRGKVFAEMRIIGHMKIGEQEYHWNKVIRIPIQRIDEPTED